MFKELAKKREKKKMYVKKLLKIKAKIQCQILMNMMDSLSNHSAGKIKLHK